MPQRIKLERLTPVAFAPFGTVIENPTISPALTPHELLPKSVEANQGSAIKYLNITTPINLYAGATSGKLGEAKMNMFACKPRKLYTTTTNNGSSGNGEVQASPAVSLRKAGLSSHNMSPKPRKEYSFPVEVLERHPFTYQTFIPMGLAPDDQDTAYLVIVAPTEIRKTNDLNNPPDVANLRAFLAHGRQAVTYAAGTWHAPMVVVGKTGVDFVVCQWSNGVANEDCEEYFISKEDAPAVILDLEVDTTTSFYDSARSRSSSSSKL